MRTRIQVVPSPGASGANVSALRESGHWLALDERARTLGFERWTFAAIATCSGRDAKGRTRVTTYPVDYVEECAARNLYGANPGFVYAMRRDAPIYYGTVRTYIPHSAPVRSFLELNRRFDVTRGVLLPLVDVLGVRSILGLCFSGSERELEDLWHGAHSSILEIARDLNRAVLSDHLGDFAAGQLPQLTRSQRDVLRELADGCSVGEAAESMGVSIDTAHKHLAAARRTLNATTTPQAVAVAVRFGLVA